jgi:hypothetical protein
MDACYCGVGLGVVATWAAKGSVSNADAAAGNIRLIWIMERVIG